MASSTPTPEVEARPQPTVAPPVQVPWWREWLKPIAVVAVISVLVEATTLVANVGMTAFQSLKADIRDGNTQLIEEIRASEDRQREDLREVKAELKADNQALGERLDRVVESLLAARSGH